MRMHGANWLESIEATLNRAGDQEGIQLLNDLGHSDTNYSWLWYVALGDTNCFGGVDPTTEWMNCISSI